MPLQPMITGARHMISAGHYLAAEAGDAILKAGGNVIDAGVAAGIALGVVHSDQVQFSGVAPIVIYLADREDGTDYGPITAANPNAFADRYDVWKPTHLPYRPNGTESPRAGAGTDARRVALNRHGKGSAWLYFDTHAAVKRTRLITINDRRDRR